MPAPNNQPKLLMFGSVFRIRFCLKSKAKSAHRRVQDATARAAHAASAPSPEGAGSAERPSPEGAAALSSGVQAVGLPGVGWFGLEKKRAYKLQRSVGCNEEADLQPLLVEGVCQYVFSLGLKTCKQVDRNKQ